MDECTSRREPKVQNVEYSGNGDRNGFKIYSPKTKLQYVDDEHKIKVYHIGTPNSRPTKTILLVGETGSGKTRLLNRMYNHICSVEYGDKYRLEIEDETGGEKKQKTDSQTEYITGYLFYYEPKMKYYFNILIIDTPGLNDTRGHAQRKIIMTRLEAFLRNEKIGIIDLHCLGMVVKANLNRCQEDLVEIHQKLFELFGKDTTEITHVLATHASDKTQDLSEILDRLKVEKVNVFFFDNGNLYSPNRIGFLDFKGKAIKESRIRMDSMFWTETDEEYEDMFLALLHSVSLAMTREALQNKNYLELVKENLIRKLNAILTSSLINQYDISLLTDIGNDVDTNDTPLVIYEQKKTKEDIVKERWYQLSPHVHNCKTCNKTCFAVCHKFIRCPITSSKCIICECPAEDHVKCTERIKEELGKVEYSREKMMRKYENSAERQAEISRLEKELEQNLENISSLLKKIYKQSELLSKICRVPCHQYIEEVAEELKKDLQHNLNTDLVNKYWSTLMTSALEKTKAIEEKYGSPLVADSVPPSVTTPPSAEVIQYDVPSTQSLITQRTSSCCQCTLI